MKLQYLSQMGLSPGSEKNNNNWTNNNLFWLAYLMFRVHIMAIFFLGINIANWQKGSLKVTVSWGIISRSLSDGCQLRRNRFLRHSRKCLHPCQISPLSLLMYSKDRHRYLRIVFTLQASCQVRKPLNLSPSWDRRIPELSNTLQKMGSDWNRFPT